MPLIVASAIRYIIMAAVQLGIWSAVENFALPLLNNAIAAVIQVFGVSEEDAKDIVANEFLQLAESVGIFAATLKTKLPLKVADRLGFTTKGYSKRTLTPTAAARTAGATSSAIQVVRGAGKVAAFLEGRLNTVFLGFLATSAFIDFGNWETGAYSQTFQKIFATVTFGLLKPDEQYKQTKTVSPEVFDKVYNAYKLQGAVEIDDPYKQARLSFTRDNLIDLLDRVGAHLLVLDGTASTKDVIEATQLMIKFNVGSAPAGAGSPTTGSAASSAPAGTVPRQIQIYTGVISQGTLGTPQEFIARPDDMIQNMDELKAAAKNNLASFVAALPGRFYYEIGIVNTVKTRSGFTQKGEAVKVVSGYTTKGLPRYKTIYHKFAVMKLGVTDENGRQIKLGTIILGPVNAVDFQPTNTQLTAVAQTITPELFTNNLADIKQVLAPAGTSVVSIPTTSRIDPITGEIINPTDADVAAYNALYSTVLPSPNASAATSTPPPPGKAVFKASNVSFFIPAGGSIFIPQNPQNINPAVYARSGDVVRMINLQTLVPLSNDGGWSVFKDKNGNNVRVTNAGQIWERAIEIFNNYTGLKYYELPQQNIADVEGVFLRGAVSTLPNQMRSFEGPNALQDFVAFLGALLPGGDIDISGGGFTQNDASRSATTLAAFFAALGKPLPSLAERAVTYEQQGLGPKSTYTGTSEQNNRLLAVLKTG